MFPSIWSCSRPPKASPPCDSRAAVFLLLSRNPQRYFTGREVARVDLYLPCGSVGFCSSAACTSHYSSMTV